MKKIISCLLAAFMVMIFYNRSYAIDAKKEIWNFPDTMQKESICNNYAMGYKPEDYIYLQSFSNTGVFTAPEDNEYVFYLFGKSGAGTDGGDIQNSKCSECNKLLMSNTGGQGGGAGGLAIHKVTLKKGEQINLAIDENETRVGSTVAFSGEDGDPLHNVGGTGGKAEGGNIGSYSGGTGGSGGTWHTDGSACSVPGGNGRGRDGQYGGMGRQGIYSILPVHQRSVSNMGAGGGGGVYPNKYLSGVGLYSADFRGSGVGEYTNIIASPSAQKYSNNVLSKTWGGGGGGNNIELAKIKTAASGSPGVVIIEKSKNFIPEEKKGIQQIPVSLYIPTDWEYVKHFSTEGTHSWTVPEDGIYNVLAVGGVGGNNSNSGSVAISQYTFKKGQVITGIQLTKERTVFQGMTATSATTAPATGGNLYNLSGIATTGKYGIVNGAIGDEITGSCRVEPVEHSMRITAPNQLPRPKNRYTDGGAVPDNNILRRYAPLEPTPGEIHSPSIKCSVEGSVEDGEDSRYCYDTHIIQDDYMPPPYSTIYGVRSGASSGDGMKYVGTVIIERMKYSPPAVVASYNNSNNTVTLQVTGDSGTTSITMGAESKAGNTTSFVVTANGEYTVSATNGSSTMSTTISVTEIDDLAPLITVLSEPTTWVKSAVLQLTLADQTTEGMQYKLADGEWIPYTIGAEIVLDKHGKPLLYVKDKWGNNGTREINGSFIDDEKPTATFTLSNNGFTNQPINIILQILEQLSGIKSIEFPDGTVFEP